MPVHCLHLSSMKVNSRILIYRKAYLTKQQHIQPCERKLETYLEISALFFGDWIRIQTNATSTFHIVFPYLLVYKDD